MHAEELIALGLVALVAGLLARAGRRIGLPTIPLFMAAGILLGPHVPGPVFVDDSETWQLLSLVGIVMLLFHLGVEFPLRQVLDSGRKLFLAGCVYIGANVTGGLAFGFLLGWGFSEALIIGGVMGISSSAIVTKLLVEFRRLANAETPPLLGIIVIEDIFLAFYLALLQPALGGVDTPGQLLLQLGMSFGFLLALFVLARFGASLVGTLIASKDNELLTILFFGLAVLVAGAAEGLGVSDAIGALMIGLVVSQTAVKERVEHHTLPLRDVFAAMFFVVFGATVDVGNLGAVLVPALVAVCITVVMNVGTGIIVARMYGFNQRAAANLGFTLLARGEFALILASLAAAAGLDARIGPFVALYVLLLSVVSPILAANTRVLARAIPDRLMVANWRYVREETMGSGCAHLDQVRVPEPEAVEGCPECLEAGDTWVELRSCLTCGKVGCCNDSANKHAAAHFEDSGHPLIRTVEPGDSWNFCFVDQVLVDIGEAGRPGSQGAAEQSGDQETRTDPGLGEGRSD